MKDILSTNIYHGPGNMPGMQEMEENKRETALALMKLTI